MEVRQLLTLSESNLKQSPYPRILLNHYKELFSADLCLSCPGTFSRMIIKLKKYYNMSNFELKGDSMTYRISKKSPKIINNNIITDELAIEFISVYPEKRILKFSKYPKNWKELVEEYLGQEIVEPEPEKPETEQSNIDIEDEQQINAIRESLRERKMHELRTLYPDIKATSKEDFIDEIIKIEQ